jgi:hypothetical protein
VSPAELRSVQERLGPSLYTSMHWVWAECLRLLAITGLRMATQPDSAGEVLQLQQDSMLRLGGVVQAAKRLTGMGKSKTDSEKTMPEEKQQQQITSQDFGKLIEAITKLAQRTTLTTVVQPPPLPPAAEEAVRQYARIASDLRTAFEVVPVAS